MRRELVGGLVLMIAAMGTSAVRADGDHGAHADGAAKKPRFIGLDHDHKETKYDLSKPEDQKKLFHEIEDGHLHELKLDAPPEIIPKRWDTGLWSIIIFFALAFVLGRFAWKPMIEGLKKREDNIRGALEQAEKTRQEALALQGQLDAKMRDAGAEIARMMDEARRDAQNLKDQMLGEARDEIQKERDRLTREVAMAKDSALQEIWQQAVSLATSMSTKAVRRGMSEDDHRRLLDESLVELKQAGSQFGRRMNS